LLEEKISSDGLSVLNMPADGNCMFSAIANQLQIFIPSDSIITAVDVRHQIVEFVRWLRSSPGNVRYCAFFNK